jgi:hypothetical protein
LAINGVDDRRTFGEAERPGLRHGQRADRLGPSRRGEQRDHGAIGVADQIGTVAEQLGDTVAARIRRSMTASL